MPLCFDVETKERRIAYRLVLLQALAALVGACVGYSIKGASEFVAILSGGGASVINGAMLAWGLRRPALRYFCDAHHQLKLIYLYAVERFLVVLALFYLCIIVLKLSPLGLLGGFVVGQLVLPVGRLFLSDFVTEIVANKNVK